MVEKMREKNMAVRNCELSYWKFDYALPTYESDAR
jgi:hypothetical protein